MPPYNFDYIKDASEREEVEACAWLVIHSEIKKLLDMGRTKDLVGELRVYTCLNCGCELIADGETIFCPDCSETYIIDHEGKLRIYTDDEE